MALLWHPSKEETNMMCWVGWWDRPLSRSQLGLEGYLITVLPVVSIDTLVVCEGRRPLSSRWGWNPRSPSRLLWNHCGEGWVSITVARHSWESRLPLVPLLTVVRLGPWFYSKCLFSVLAWLYFPSPLFRDSGFPWLFWFILSGCF